MNEIPARATLEPTAHLRAMINNAPMVLWMLDEHGVFTFSEGKGWEVLGLRPGEVVGRSVFDVYAEAGTVLEEACTVRRGARLPR